MRAIETEGKTEEEAVEAALSQLGVPRDQVQVEVLAEEYRGGILGFLGQQVVRVRVSVKEGAEVESVQEPEGIETATAGVSVPEPAQEPTREEGEQAPQLEEVPEPAEPVSPTPEEPVSEPEVAEGEEPGETGEGEEPTPSPEEEIDEDFDWSEEALLLAQDFLDAMGLDLTASIAEVDGGDVRLEMEGPDLGILIGRQGATINAFQYLINVILNRQSPTRLRVVIDGEGYRARRERTLKRMARNAADRAKRTGREVRMEPLRSFERRIVHLALQEDPDVLTYSEGEEPYRRVLVAPSRQDDDLLEAPDSSPEAVTPDLDRSREPRRDKPVSPRAGKEEDDFERRWLEEDELDENEGVDYDEVEEETIVSSSPDAAPSPEKDSPEPGGEQAADEPVIS